jgi:5-methylcytosine-specific restriction endonuclease McrA
MICPKCQSPHVLLCQDAACLRSPLPCRAGKPTTPTLERLAYLESRRHPPDQPPPKKYRAPQWARDAAPPIIDPLDFVGWVVGFLVVPLTIAGLCALIVWLEVPDRVSFFAGICAVFVPSATAAVSMRSLRRRTLAQRMRQRDEWERTWICTECLHKWIPG